jgi:hypothetical protein
MSPMQHMAPTRPLSQRQPPESSILAPLVGLYYPSTCILSDILLVVLLADNFFESYLRAIPGAKLDTNEGLITFPKSSVSEIQPLNFTIGGAVFSLDAAAQIIPIDQNTAWGLPSGVQYGIVSYLGTNSGEGLDFIIGQKFMEKYYAVSCRTAR